MDVEEEESSFSKAIKVVTDQFRGVLNYKTYRVNDIHRTYTEQVARNISKAGRRVTFETRGYVLAGSDQIAVLGFHNRFKIACDQIRVSEDLAVWCFKFFLTSSTVNEVQPSLSAQGNKRSHCGREELSSDSEVISYILRRFPNHEIVAEPYPDLQNALQFRAITEREFGAELWKTRCAAVTFHEIIGSNLCWRMAYWPPSVPHNLSPISQIVILRSQQFCAWLWRGPTGMRRVAMKSGGPSSSVTLRSQPTRQMFTIQTQSELDSVIAADSGAGQNLPVLTLQEGYFATTPSAGPYLRQLQTIQRRVLIYTRRVD